jgi:hypothetical protein
MAIPAKGHNVEFIVDMPGLATLRKVMTPDSLYLQPWRDGMEKLAGLASSRAQSFAPVGQTGKLRRSVRAVVQKKPFPTWLAVRVYAKAGKKRYSYPKMLNYSPKHHHKLWLDRAIDPVWSGAEHMLNEIGAEIGRNWMKDKG